MEDFSFRLLNIYDIQWINRFDVDVKDLESSHLLFSVCAIVLYASISLF